MLVFTFYNHQQNKVLLVLFERHLDDIETGTVIHDQLPIDKSVTCEFTGCVLPEKCWVFIKDTVTCQPGG